MLRGAGCEVSAPDTGCCGMSGSFGYQPQFYEASKRIAGLALLPALAAAPDAVVVADGFSCREQIESLGARPTLHLAEVLAGMIAELEPLPWAFVVAGLPAGGLRARRARLRLSDGRHAAASRW